MHIYQQFQVYSSFGDITYYLLKIEGRLSINSPWVKINTSKVGLNKKNWFPKIGPIHISKSSLGCIHVKNDLLYLRQYCGLLLLASQFFVQTNFQKLLPFLYSRVFTYTPLKDGSPHCPVTLGFLHLARRGVFLKGPIEAWQHKNFEKRQGVEEWPLFCQTDTSTQTLKVRS